MKFPFPTLFLIIAFLFFTPSAQAGEIKDILKHTEAVSLAYGMNNLKLGKTDGTIIKGIHKTGTSGTGDVFTVLIFEKEGWQFVYHDAPKNRSPLFFSFPHTNEDSLVSLRFFISNKDVSKNNWASLYILQASRDLGEALNGKEASIHQASHVRFILYQLVYDDTFGIYTFKAIKNERTQQAYCNADWAIFKELALAVPSDGNEYDCEKLK